MVLELVWDVLDLAGDGAKVLKILQESLFFMSLPGVLKDMDIHYEAGDGVKVIKISQETLLKVSSTSNIRKLVKTPSILQVSSWSLGGQ